MIARPGDPELRLTYTYLRLLLMLAPALLFLTSLLGFFWLGVIAGSISEYYSGPFRDVLVGVMFALAACMIAYKGNDLEDFSLNVAGFCAVFVALVPAGLEAALAQLPDQGSRAQQLGGLRIAVLAVLLASCLFVWFDFRHGLWAPDRLVRRPGTGVLTILLAVLLVAFVGLVVWRLVVGDGFAWVHRSAAGLLILSLAVAVSSHAWPERSDDPTAGVDAAGRSYRRVYRAITYLMAAGLPLVLVLDYGLRWPYAILAVEWYEIALFSAYWALETRRNWAPGVGLAARQRRALGSTGNT